MLKLRNQIFFLLLIQLLILKRKKKHQMQIIFKISKWQSGLVNHLI